MNPKYGNLLNFKLWYDKNKDFIHKDFIHKNFMYKIEVQEIDMC